MTWNLYTGLYFTAGCLWFLIFGIVTSVTYFEWREERDKKHQEDKARDARQRYLSCLVMTMLSPIWPVPALLFVTRGVRAVWRDTGRAIRETIKEFIENKNDRLK